MSFRCHAPLPASAKASARLRTHGRAGALAEAASGASSIPETLVLEPLSRGVLGRPVMPGDDTGFIGNRFASKLEVLTSCRKFARAPTLSDNLIMLACAPARRTKIGRAAIGDCLKRCEWEEV